MYYLNMFIIYSIFGYFFETLISTLTGSGFKSGIMIGPWTPIYGLGVVIIVLLSSYLFMNLHMPRIYETIIAFLIITIVLTVLEWLGGKGIELLFHKVYWDYSSHKFNIGKYISLSVSLTWGIGSIILIYIIHPILKNLIMKIPFVVTLILSVLFVVDFIYTILNNTKI